jgi:ketosteroid isomerase-like protein
MNSVLKEVLMGSPEKAIINRFFAAMQVGATAEDDMMRLFAEDAVYIEPFSGKVRTHTGKLAIRKCMLDGWKRPLPDIRIEIEELTVHGEEVLVRWICRSPALPGGTGRGENRFTVKDGLIIRLETSIIPSKANA